MASTNSYPGTAGYPPYYSASYHTRASGGSESQHLLTTPTYYVVNSETYTTSAPRKSSGRRKLLSICLCLCISLIPLLTYFLFPRYPLVTYKNIIQTGTNPLTFQYSWDISNFNYADLYLIDVDYKLYYENQLIGNDTSIDRTVFYPRSVSRLTTTTTVVLLDVVREIIERCDAGEIILFKTKWTVEYKVFASTLVADYPAYVSTLDCSKRAV